MHPFGFAELKDTLEDLERFEEQMRRTTRGKSIRQSQSMSEASRKSGENMPMS